MSTNRCLLVVNYVERFMKGRDGFQWERNDETSSRSVHTWLKASVHRDISSLDRPSYSFTAVWLACPTPVSFGNGGWRAGGPCGNPRPSLVAPVSLFRPFAVESTITQPTATPSNPPSIQPICNLQSSISARTCSSTSELSLPDLSAFLRTPPLIAHS